MPFACQICHAGEVTPSDDWKSSTYKACTSMVTTRLSHLDGASFASARYSGSACRGIHGSSF